MAERLSRERILEVARRIASDEGLDALSMRRIAQQLDVWPMSLYRHFADKEALLDALTADARALAGSVRAAATESEGRLPRELEGLRGAGERAAGSAELWRTLETYAIGAAVRGMSDADFEEGLDLLLQRG